MHTTTDTLHTTTDTLWDADPGVCCAAFQLGACPHTEAEYEYDDVDDAAIEAAWRESRPEEAARYDAERAAYLARLEAAAAEVADPASEPF